jgi:hypothetical protein
MMRRKFRASKETKAFKRMQKHNQNKAIYWKEC